MKTWGMLALTSLCMVGCSINKDYDLSDLDVTTRIQVKDLTLPVQLNEVTLSQVMSLKEDDQIKEVNINGETCYAVTEEGDFCSDPIQIPAVKIPAPKLEASEVTLEKIIPQVTPAPAAQVALPPIEYRVPGMERTFSYESNPVDPTIKTIESIQTNATIQFELRCLGVEEYIKTMRLENFQVQMPKGLVLTVDPQQGSYNAETGILQVADIVSYNEHAQLTVQVTGIDFNDAGVELDAENQLNWESHFKVLDGGKMTLQPEEITASAPVNIDLDDVKFRVSYTLSPIEATHFTGEVQYALDGMDVEAVKLNVVSNFLTDKGTNLKLDNPQIYLTTNNPVANYGLTCQAGVTLTARRGVPITPNFSEIPYSIDDPYFTIGCDKGTEGDYRFVFAPEKRELVHQDWDNFTFVPFTSLRNVLYSEEEGGLPDEIGIHIDDPQIPRNRVENFQLNTSVPGVKGTYELIAPLALGEGSQILYTSTETGWNDSTLDDLVIQQLSLQAMVDNNTPLDVELIAYPLDINGNRIKDVKLASTLVKAQTKEQPLHIGMTGTITHLDGVYFEAKVIAASSTTMQPTQTIVLKNVRLTASGHIDMEE